MDDGRLVLCPVTMNHVASEDRNGRVARANGAYWRRLEIRLASVCDDLMVLMVDGWLDSRGVGRERELFEATGKPITFLKPGAPLSSADPTDRPN